MAIVFQKRTNPAAEALQNEAPNFFYPYNPFEICSSGNDCTWYAWGRFCEVWHQVDKTVGDKAGQMWPSSPNGNAYNWYNHAKNSEKFMVGTTPKPGAIICWGYNYSSTGGPGHVAFVEEVFEDGSIEISQGG